MVDGKDEINRQIIEIEGKKADHRGVAAHQAPEALHQPHDLHKTLPDPSASIRPTAPASGIEVVRPDKAIPTRLQAEKNSDGTFSLHTHLIMGDGNERDIVIHVDSKGEFIDDNPQLRRKSEEDGGKPGDLILRRGEGDRFDYGFILDKEDVKKEMRKADEHSFVPVAFPITDGVRDYLKNYFLDLDLPGGILRVSQTKVTAAKDGGYDINLGNFQKETGLIDNDIIIHLDKDGNLSTSDQRVHVVKPGNATQELVFDRYEHGYDGGRSPAAIWLDTDEINRKIAGLERENARKASQANASARPAAPAPSTGVAKEIRKADQPDAARDDSNNMHSLVQHPPIRQASGVETFIRSIIELLVGAPIPDEGNVPVASIASSETPRNVEGLVKPGDYPTYGLRIADDETPQHGVSKMAKPASPTLSSKH